MADSGYMRSSSDETGLIMTLYNGKGYTEMEEKNVSLNARKYPSRKDIFKVETIIIPLTGFDLQRSEDGLFKSNAAMLNLSQLSYTIDSISKKLRLKSEKEFTTFKNTKLYVVRNFKLNVTKNAQETENQTRIKRLGVKVLLDSLNNMDKKTVLTKAIETLKEGTTILTNKNDSKHNEIKSLRRYEVEWHKKLTMSLACLIFFFIGAPLGAIIRKGGLGTPAVISVFFFVIYYVISISAQKLVEEDVVGTFAGMWAASYILLPIGIFLTYKATTDSVILNIETYLLFYKKIKDFFYRLIFIDSSKNSRTN
jgi:lipopolysaccharide export system permease protein